MLNFCLNCFNRGTGKKGKAAFRQAFGRINVLRSFLGNKPVLGLTATADKSMRQQLCKHLNFKGHKEILVSPNRQNIRFTVANADKNLLCFNWLVTILKSLKEDAPFTIIFCHTVSDIVLVLSSFMARLGKDAYVDGTAQESCLLGVYYSATSESEKQRITKSFNGAGTVRVAIASTSLSMGVDFPHVTYVIHFGPGRTVVDHLQQAGRAGRDSEQAFNIIYYHGKHIRLCEQLIRDVIKKEDHCVRELLLCHFTNSKIDVPTIKHNCCSRCHRICSCSTDGKCVKPFYKFDHIVADEITNNVNTNQAITRHVTDDDRTCLKEALQEVQLSLAVSAGVTLFDSSGLITHGFSDNIIESITLNCDKIFNIHDLMEYGFISSIHLALVVLEVFNEIFEDVEIDTSLYNIATLTVPVYNTILNATATLHQIEQCTNDHTSSDSDE